jgi:hypothetical protein
LRYAEPRRDATIGAIVLLLILRWLALEVAGEQHSDISIIRECERGNVMARAAARKKPVARRDWTHAEVKELKKYSKDKTRVKTISRALKRTPGALRQKARVLGIPLGHRRSKNKGT